MAPPVPRNQSMWSMNGIPVLAFALTVAASASVPAQGGPPMITDDPGTPGSRTWEINYPGVDFQTPGSHADIPGLTDSARALELPFEIAQAAGPDLKSG